MYFEFVLVLLFALVFLQRDVVSIIARGPTNVVQVQVRTRGGASTPRRYDRTGQKRHSDHRPRLVVLAQLLQVTCQSGRWRLLHSQDPLCQMALLAPGRRPLEGHGGYARVVASDRSLRGKRIIIA